MKYFVLSIVLIFMLSFSVSANAMTNVSVGHLTTGTVLGNPNIIGIILSNTCIALVKQNLTNDCPSYYKIKNLDNSNQIVSGKFVFTNGFYHRLIPKTDFSYQMYKTGTNVIILDPDFNTISYSNTKLIFIVPHGFTYKINTDNVNNTDRYQYFDRNVDSACKVAIISYSPSLLNDTISYLYNGCVSTTFKEKHDIKRQETPLNYNSQSAKNQAWYLKARQVTQDCITKVCKPLKDPNSKF